MARNRPSVAQLIENLPFVDVVNTMLLEGTSASDVAAFIQDDQNALRDVRTKTLVNALSRRKKHLQDEIHEYEEEGDSGDGDGYDWFSTRRPAPEDDQGPAIPSALSRAAYKRVKDGINELHELEGLYLSQRDRLDRLIQREASIRAFSDMTSTEFKTAADLLMKRVAVKEKLGILDGEQRRGDVSDFEGYSKETAELLSEPKARRRVVSLVERLAQNERAIQKAEAEKKADDEETPKAVAG